LLAAVVVTGVTTVTAPAVGTATVTVVSFPPIVVSINATELTVVDAAAVVEATARSSRRGLAMPSLANANALKINDRVSNILNE
jgi:hypothetical protein